MNLRKDDCLKLLHKGDSNWDKYDNNGMVMAIAKKDSGCKDSYFGDYHYFARWVYLNGEFDGLTEYGREIYEEYGARFLK